MVGQDRIPTVSNPSIDLRLHYPVCISVNGGETGKVFVYVRSRSVCLTNGPLRNMISLTNQILEVKPDPNCPAA
jgi:hypothetical protein